MRERKRRPARPRGGWRISWTLAACLLGWAGSGCQATFGPQALQRTHPAYNQAIVEALDEQMLLNLVRLKYRDNPYFLEVGSVTASLSMGATAGLDTDIPSGSASTVFKPKAGVSYSQTPTLSFVPLRGQDFLRSVLAPLPLEAMLVLTQSGWSIERVFGICMERVNDLRNAPTASGPTPASEPEYRKFRELLDVLRRLQVEDAIEMGADPESKRLLVRIRDAEERRELLDSLTNLLDLDPGTDGFSISSNFLESDGRSLIVRPRSIASILYYLSQNVEVPPADRDGGLVTVTQASGGGDFDWSRTPAGAVFRVRASRERPQDAGVAVPYRGHWFYIADSDLESKSTFMLLRSLFNLQSGQSTVTGPTLTLPVGGR